MYPQVVQKEDNGLHWIHQALDSDESKNSIIQRNNQAKDKNANKQEATSWIAYNLKEWSRNWNKDKQ